VACSQQALNREEQNIPPGSAKPTAYAGVPCANAIRQQKYGVLSGNVCSFSRLLPDGNAAQEERSGNVSTGWQACGRQEQ
jgi:hypothetical protein